LQLQFLSSQLGVWVIRAAGISVLLEGNIIDLGNYQLEVAEACSGLRYLFPLMTLSFIAACMFRGPLWKRVVIFLSSVPITVFMNSVRIGLIGITVEHWGTRMAEGVLHDFEGWLVFMLSTGAMMLVAFGLSRVGRSKVLWSQAFHTGIAPLGKNKVAPATGRAVPRSFVAALVLVLIGAAASVAAPAPASSAPTRQSFADFPTRIDDWVGRRDALQRFYLDILQLDDYILVDFSESGGPPVNFYSAWYQAQEDNRAIHSPHDCIPGGGWEIVKFEQRMLPATQTTHAFEVNRAVVQLGTQRQIVYYWFDERGRKITSEYVARWYLFWDALTRGRTDGALVRFVAPLPAGADEATAEAQADARIVKLATRIEPMLNHYVPD
jgi:exosortase D (VPLPA-CTERM-specific)